MPDNVKQCRDNSFQTDCTNYGGDMPIEMVIRGGSPNERTETTSDLISTTPPPAFGSQSTSNLLQLGIVIGGAALVIFLAYKYK